MDTTTEPHLSLNLALLKPLQGQRVSLVRRAPQYADFIIHCIQNTQFINLYRLSENRQQTEEALRQRLAEEERLLPQQLHRVEWVVLRHEQDYLKARPIGLAAIADYQVNHGRGEFLIGIPDAAEQKMGVGLEASLLVLDYAFNALKLNKLISFVYSYNHHSQANTLQLGFTQEGFLREHIHNATYGYVSLYQNGLLVTEFRSNHRLSRLSCRLLGYDVTQIPRSFSPASDEQIQQFKAELTRLRRTE